MHTFFRVACKKRSIVESKYDLITRVLEVVNKLVQYQLHQLRKKCIDRLRSTEKITRWKKYFLLVVLLSKKMAGVILM